MTLINANFLCFSVNDSSDRCVISLTALEYLKPDCPCQLVSCIAFSRSKKRSINQ